MATQMVVGYGFGQPEDTPLTSAQMVSLIASPILPTDLLDPIGVTFVSQSTSDTGLLGVIRGLTFSLLPVFQSFEPPAAITTRVPWYGGSIVSSDANDTLGGSGLQRLRIRKAVMGDPNGGEAFGDVTLNGTTPVNMTGLFENDDFAYQYLQGTSTGVLQQFSMPNLGGDLVQMVVLGQYRPSIFSDNENDTALGSGARTIQVDYDDFLGNPHSETVTLNGTTPVNFVATDVAIITAMSVASAGLVTQNIGTITVKTAINGAGGIGGRLLPSFFAYFPPTDSDIRAPFFNLFTIGIASKVSARCELLTGPTAS